MGFKLCQWRNKPLQEQQFITDQRPEREMTFGTVDLQIIQELQKTDARKGNDASFSKLQLEVLGPSEVFNSFKIEVGEQNVKVLAA
ncbi:hypothetical protein AVEN_54581-1 [Araneus ventricosus]|uniref:Uncharacterized protein n=1 Tax=Araneus ventricosus TaxID=182803 RepID=A0A4Y2BNC0_ARAVE|nr:hypothetical protein AVEN_54581-1 [Araneus ventricosus]